MTYGGNGYIFTCTSARPVRGAHAAVWDRRREEREPDSGSAEKGENLLHIRQNSRGGEGMSGVE